ncbi:MAG TPA: hypothetical protein VNF91_04650 [Candidatus Acidoferrum sp.]|nr:hypothetical protein [Candidatus Acidoferrum sp.]
MAKRAATDYYRANQGFSTMLDGDPVFVQKGELVHKDHPLLKGRRDLFDPAENFGRFDVEQATAAPGEKRAAEPEEAESEPPAQKRGPRRG